MGFESFCVHLYPNRNSPLYTDQDSVSLLETHLQICKVWPHLREDEVEEARSNSEIKQDEVYLVSEIEKGLIQMILALNRRQHNSIVFVFNVAYCNPRSVAAPFCDMVAGLMRRYRLYCHVVSDLAPRHLTYSDDIDSPSDVAPILSAAIDYNREIWFNETGTREEAPLRRHEAVATFVWPKLQSIVSSREEGAPPK